MIATELQQRLRELLAQYGAVKSLQMFEREPEHGCLVLVTMDSSESAMAAQAGLGVNAFGMDTLIFSEPWLRNTLGPA